MRKFLIFLLTLIFILSIFITPCLAFNGQMSFDGGYSYNSNNDVGLRFGGNTFDRPYTALVNDEGLSFTIQIPPQNDRTLYLCPVSGDYYNQYSDLLLADYIDTLTYNNILTNDGNYSTGAHTIYIGDYTSIYGNYKLCLHDETAHDVYELYFYYIPSVEGSYFAVNFDRSELGARLRTFTNNTLINTYDNLPVSENGDFAYLGRIDTYNRDSIFSVSLTLGKWDSTPMSDFYILNIPFISFSWSTDNNLLINKKCNWCSISVVNNTKRTLYRLGTVNNITSYVDTNLNSNKGYSFFIPSNFADIGDVITLQCDFQFEDKEYPVNYEIFLKGVSFVAWNIRDLDLGGKYNTLDEFEKAQEEYKNYFSNIQIDIDDIDLDIHSYVDQGSITKAFALGNKILSIELFFTILVICITIALCSYIFFGKK